ncbi:MAG: NUDIX hydrolase [Inhella sp.]
MRAIVIDSAQAVLLIQPHGYRDGNWTLVGGGVEHGETTEQAMRRELAEEVGLVDLLELWQTGEPHRFLFDERKRRSHALDHEGQSATLFIARVAAGASVRLQTEEVKRHCWVPMAQAAQHFQVAAQREWVQRALIDAAPKIGRG